MTQCLNCNSTFVSNEHNFGHPQLYCSTKCANRERHKRYIQKKSAEITENIACEFADWLVDIKSSIAYNVTMNDETCLRLYKKSTKELFQEYIKTKENEAKIHLVK